MAYENCISNSPHEVLFFTIKSGLHELRLGILFFCLKVKLILAYITQLHMITCFNVSASIFLLWEFCLFQSYSPWYRKAMKSPLKPTLVPLKYTCYPVYLEREMPKVSFSSL